MPVHIKSPVRVEAAGNKPKIIDEFIGRVNSGTDEISIARMKSPGGWTEPAQTPEFDEYTLVLKGSLQVEADGKQYQVGPGEAIIVEKGTTVRYSTPGDEGAEYIAVCLPAFSPETVHRQT